MDLNVVACSGHPLDVIDHQEKRPVGVLDENLLRGGWPPGDLRQQTADTFLYITVIRLLECLPGAFDAAREPIPVKRLQQIVERLQLECLDSVFGWQS